MNKVNKPSCIINPAKKITLMYELQQRPDDYFSCWPSISEHLYKYCRFKLMLNHWDAEDVVGDTMLKAYDSFKTANPSSNIRGWLTLLARNIQFDKLRRSQSKSIEATFSNQEYLIDEPFKNSADIKSIKVVKAVINRLNDKNKAITFDFFFNEKNYKEISHEHSIPAHQVRQRIHRAREKIKTSLNKI
ncbi:sigma-70 family RNA polymerase sigma factor [Shewanella nanhaiensis]|uniref:Sigma-70 family RNA polymerase sigma factor n=1 Tax=Shewanella nanhaiensis TaxID=2864872 RepID=A0ABS7E9H4_9GAMM|nr:sigma-70 family RNA polymerase sigma factor [Shewanella nanhaiensis]MBW8186322.1 sigma-70 family RNA polymerase sigma factor [Shewanella nanhaiensis]